MLEYCTESPLLALYQQWPSLLVVYVGSKEVPTILLLQRAVRISQLVDLREVINGQKPLVINPLRLAAELDTSPQTMTQALHSYLRDVHSNLRKVQYSLMPRRYFRRLSPSDLSLRALFERLSSKGKQPSYYPLTQVTLDVDKLCLYCFPT